MKVSALLKAIVADLKLFASANHGECTLAPEEWHALFKLNTSPRGFVCVVLFDGETPADESLPEEPLNDAGFSVFIQVAGGLEAEPSAMLVQESTAGRPGLIDLIESARVHVQTRTHTANDCAEHPTYLGMSQVAVATENGSLPLRCFRLRFRQKYAPDALTYRQPV